MSTGRLARGLLRSPTSSSPHAMAATTQHRSPKPTAHAPSGAHPGVTSPRARAAGQGPRVEGSRVIRKPKGRKQKQQRSRHTAATADKYELYQKAVQSADTDVEFHRRVYKKLRGREPLHFREDFCGTGLLSSAWIQQSARHTAEGFDIDPEPVAWGLARNFDPLEEAARRYTVHLKDVREPGQTPADVRVAQNFSYYCFKTRKLLLEYFRSAREHLAPDGLFIIDLYGGSESGDSMEETTRCRGFDYVWEQESYFPGTGEYNCSIHFRFPDGTELRRAFTYRWRQWSLTELRDLLEEAGFSRVISYFEGTAKNGSSGDGVFRPGLRGEHCAAWIAYLVALK